VLTVIAYSLFLVGGLCSLLNFYLSFLRYPLYKFLRREYRWESGIPLFGSLFLATGVALLWSNAAVFWLGVVLVAIDTGGLPWFIGVMLWHSVVRPRNADPA
jgi:hypothetical protein